MDPAVHPGLRTTSTGPHLTTQAEGREQTTLDNPGPSPVDDAHPGSTPRT
jgi:hypothetical protein